MSETRDAVKSGWDVLDAYRAMIDGLRRMDADATLEADRQFYLAHSGYATRIARAEDEADRLRAERDALLAQRDALAREVAGLREAVAATEWPMDLPDELTPAQAEWTRAGMNLIVARLRVMLDVESLAALAAAPDLAPALALDAAGDTAPALDAMLAAIDADLTAGRFAEVDAALARVPDTASLAFLMGVLSATRCARDRLPGRARIEAMARAQAGDRADELLGGLATPARGPGEG